MENKIEIGQQIKRKRLQSNLRMDDVAKQAGITRSTLWSIERGKGNYSIDTLLRLLSILGMSFDLGTTASSGDRKRAKRVNTALDKKINRFVIMCVEQYASFVNKGSEVVYRALNENGIIKELIEDYEDMHGMSSEYINDYIGKRLGWDNPNEAVGCGDHVLSKTILITQTVELIAKKYRLSIDDARSRFYESGIVELLDDDETGLYGESALYLFSLYEAKLVEGQK